jgi:tetratricopeptide (TPR) repeat protein
MILAHSRVVERRPDDPLRKGSTRAVLLLLLIASAAAAGAGTALLAAPSALQEIAAGWEQFEKQNWTESEAAFRRAISIDPELAEAYKGLAEALLRQGREREAAAAIRDGLPHLGDQPAALLPLAEILSRNDSTRSAALPLYRTLVDGSPKDAPLRLELARNLAWSGHHREALEECRRLQEKGTGPEIRAEARLLEAQVLSWSGRSREAEAVYRGILADGPSVEAHLGMGDIARWEGRYGDADAHYRDALKTAPDDPLALQSLEANRRDGDHTITARYGRFDDSSDFERESYTLFADLFRMRRLSVRAGAARIRYEDASGRQLYRTAVPLQGRFWVGRFISLRGGVAINEYTGDAPDTTSWFVHGDLSPGADRVRIRLGYHHYDLIDDTDPFEEHLYNQAETIDVARQGIDIDEIRAGLLVRLTDRMSLNSDVGLGDISDDNERVTAYNRLSYRLPGDPRIELFGAFFYQNLRDNTVLYWDPSNFQMYGLGARLEGEVEKRFRYIVEGQLGFHPREEDRLGGQIYGVAEWDLAELYTLRLTANHLTSPVERAGFGDDYDATYLSVGLVRRFVSPAAGAPAASQER